METPAPTTVFLVDDSPSILERLTDLLGDIEGLQIVGDAETPARAIEGILRLRPAWVVLDYQLCDGTGVDVLRAVHPMAPNVVFVVLTNHPTQQYRRLCLDAGASWFLDKSTEFSRIKDVILGANAAER